MVRRRNTLQLPAQQYSLPILAVVMAILALGGLYLIFRSHAFSADVNSDGVVDIKDLSIVAGHFGQTGVTFAQGDINGDGRVDIADLSLLAAAWGGGAQPNPIQVSQLPATLGNYSEIFSPYNSTIFCADQLASAYDPSIQAWRQYFTYGGFDRQQYITTRTLPNGRWQTPVNLKSALLNVDIGQNGHNCMVIGIDSEGYLHVIGTHDSPTEPLVMAQSTAPYSIDSWVNVPTLGDPSTEFPVSYPDFFKTPDGTLFLAYGNGNPGLTLKWYLYRWDTSSGNPGHWVKVVQLTDANGQNLYPWRIAVDRSNTATKGRIHFFGTWRVGKPTAESPNPNEDLVDFYSDDDGVTWHQYGNPNPITMPITYDEGTRIIDTDHTGPGNRFIVNSGGLDIDSQGHPHALVLMSTTAGTNIRRVYHVWYDGSQWHLDPLNSLGAKPRSSVFSDNAGNTWGLISPDAGDKISVINLTPGSPGFETQIFPVAQDLDFGADSQYAIFDTGLLNGQNELSFMFTQLGGLDPTTQPDANYRQPAYIETIPLDQLASIGAGGVTIPHLVSQDIQTGTSQSVSGNSLQKLLTSATVSGPQQLYVKITATAHVSATGTTMTLRAVKSTESGDVSFGQLDFSSTTSTTESTPWLPVQLGGNYSGVISGAGQISAGSGSGTIDSLKIEVSSLVY